MEQVPESFVATIIDIRGDAGADWLLRLGETIALCEEQWSLRAQPPFADLSYNFVAPVVRDDSTEAILKLGAPHNELRTEIDALRHIRGGGAVRLLDADPDLGAMLLERLNPGATLDSVGDDEQATSIAAHVMKQLWRPVPSDHEFPSVWDWATGIGRLRNHLEGETGPFSTRLVEQAEAIYSEFMIMAGEPVLLHGDLHHENILSAERDPWLAIDPKGVIGEAEYEVGAFLRNHFLDTPEPGRLMARRVDQFAEELGFDRQRIIDWGLAQAVLSAWWSFESHGEGWDDAIACAELLAKL